MLLRDNPRRIFFLISLDGALWALMYGLAEHYLVPFALLFNATPFQVTLLTGFGQLAIALAHILGGLFILHYRRRQQLCLIGNLSQATSWLLILGAGLFLGSPIWIIIVYFIGTFVTGFATPGWLSWMNDIIPSETRGRFWGRRNSVIGVFQFTAILLGGIALYAAQRGFLDLMGVFAGLFCLAFLSRAASWWPIKHTPEPEMERNEIPVSAHSYLEFFRSDQHRNFTRYIRFIFVINFSMFIMNALLPIQILQTLGCNYLEYMILTMMTNMLTFLFMFYWGPLADRFGNYQILLTCGFFILLPPLGWAFSHHFAVLIVFQLLHGFGWSGVSLAAMNFTFDSHHRHQMPTAMAVYFAVTNLAAFSGSFMGGFLARYVADFHFWQFSSANLELIFLISMVGRLWAVFYLLKQFKEVRTGLDPVPSQWHLLVYLPARNVFNQIRQLNTWRDNPRS